MRFTVGELTTWIPSRTRAIDIVLLIVDDLIASVTRTLHDAGVDEHDLTGGSPAEAVSLVDSQLHDFGAVREGFSEAGFALLVFKLGALSFQTLQPSGCHVRPDVEFSFSFHQKLDHPTDLAQLFVPFLVHRGLGV